MTILSLGFGLLFQFSPQRGRKEGAEMFWAAFGSESGSSGTKAKLRADQTNLRLGFRSRPIREGVKDYGRVSPCGCFFV